MPVARIRTIVLDCPDPRALAEFYRELLGGEITDEADDWVNLDDGASVFLAFQRVEDHLPPTWPEGAVPQQLHLDLTVDDIEAAEAQVLAAGATKHAVQPGDDDPEDDFRVYLDPAGHPFCLCWD